MNPPYGRCIEQWMEKAVRSMLGGGNSCLPCPRKDGYSVVEQVGYAICLRGAAYKRSTEIWTR